MLSIIAAIGRNNVIGINNSLPWKLSGDLKYFAKTTAGKSVLMGKNTFLSIVKMIGKPLPNRKNYVLSRTETEFAGAEIIRNIQDFISSHKDEEVFVIGGASIYELTLPLVDRMYLTEVEFDGAGDAFFPAFDRSEWKLISEEKHLKEEKNECNYNFKIYERK